MNLVVIILAVLIPTVAAAVVEPAVANTLVVAGSIVAGDCCRVSFFPAAIATTIGITAVTVITVAVVAEAPPPVDLYLALGLLPRTLPPREAPLPLPFGLAALVERAASGSPTLVDRCGLDRDRAKG